MKVLWFTNTPCSAAEKLSPKLYTGGWLASLEKEFSKRDDVDLHIVFYFTKHIEPYKHNNTYFYPVKRKNSGSKIERYFKRLLKIDDNDKFQIKTLLSIISQINPDIIHVHGTEDNFGLIQHHTDIPVVISIQGILNPYIEKFYTGIPSAVANKYESLKSKLLVKSSKYNYQNFVKKAIRELEILKITKNVIGRTDWDKRITRMLAPESSYFEGQEILRSSFYGREWSKTEFHNKIQIITISNNIIYKGYETIVKTAKILSSLSSFNYEWLVIGLHKKSGIVVLTQNWLKIYSKNSNIKLLGEKNEEEIVNLLINADIYCQVSHIENSPNSLCEAMILGMPIIASFVGGTNSILENGKEGILVQDGDPYILAGAILEMSHNFQVAKKFSQNAKFRATKRHERDRITMELIDVYKSLIKNN